MFYSFLIGLFVLTSILMVIVILMQASKGGGLASSFGGLGGAGGVLSARSATSFLQKVTIGLAILYGVLCITISLISVGSDNTLESKTQQQILNEQQQQQTAPAATDLPASDAPDGDNSTPPADENAPQQPGQGSGEENKEAQENK